MKKKLIHFLIFLSTILLSSNIITAQVIIEDVVYLKDGSMFRGTIREQLPDSIVRIEIIGENVITLPSKQLDHIEYSVRRQIKDASADTVEHFKSRGYFNATELGVMPGTNYTTYYYSAIPQASTGFTIQTVNGYRFSRNLLAGAGLGMDIIGAPMFQLFADGRYEILNRKATPYIVVNAGYGFPLTPKQGDIYSETSYKGGFMWSAGAGMRFNFHREGAFLVSVGYKVDKRTETISGEWQPYETTNEYTYNRLVMRIGLAF